MDKYEYRVKTEQMLEYMEKKQYRKAMEIADTIDWRRVKNTSMLNSVSEIYEYNGEFQKSRDVLFVAYDRSPGSRKIVYRLGTLALKNNDPDEASDCYEEFVKLAPKDPNQFILKYKILRARHAPIAEQIAALEDFKKAEYVEKWAYELANLYHQAGMAAECLEECDDLILWFSEGKYVYQAMELKMKYKPLTPLQQEKYNNHSMKTKGSSHFAAAAASKKEIQAEPENAESETAVEEVAQREEIEKSDSTVPSLEADTVQNEAETAMTDGEESKVREESPIRKTVKGATLAEALANGVALANGLDIEKRVNSSTKRDEELRITGQMKIEEILQEWEEKQKSNAEAIENQKKKDEERLAKERSEIEKRREEEARRLEEQQRAAEEARRIAEQKAAEEARKQALREAEEARILAEQKAEEERRQKEAADAAEERLLDHLASGKATEAFEKAVSADEQEIEEETKIHTESEEPDLPDENLDVSPDLQQLTDKLEQSVEEDDESSAESVHEESEEEYDDFEEPEEEYEDFEELDEAELDDYEEPEEEYDDFEELDEEYDDFEELDEEEEFDEEFQDELIEEEPEEELVIEEPTEEEIQERLKKGKSGVPFDTGFVVTGRYDLSATSEIGLKAGLTEEQKKLFSYFVPVRGMSEQIVEVLDNDRREQRDGTSRTGNILVVGQPGSGKTVLAVDIVKAIQKQRNLRQGKVAIVTGDSMNKKELSNIIKKLRGGAIIIEKAGKLNTRTVKELNHLMEKKTGELLFVLEDQKKMLDKLFIANPDFKKKFTSSLELPVFINDELVTFGQTYAKENGYKLDEMGILALYSRIDVMQREDHAVTVAEVKEIMDRAIDHSQKVNVRHLARRVFGKSTDSSDRIILKEEDFRF